MAERRTATLATMAGNGRPRLVPICFVLSEPAAGEHPERPLLYSPLDEKPKRGDDPRTLARVRDIVERPDVTMLFERWSEDWSRLAWLRAQGRATLMEPDAEPEAHRLAVEALRTKYPQYRDHRVEASPMIRIEITATRLWSSAEDGSLG